MNVCVCVIVCVCVNVYVCTCGRIQYCNEELRQIQMQRPIDKLGHFEEEEEEKACELEEHLRRLDGQGRIAENRCRKIGLGLHDGQQVEDQLLRPSHCKGRHQQGPAGSPGRTQLFRQGPTSRGQLEIDPLAVPVGALQNDVVDPDRPGRCRQERLSS